VPSGISGDANQAVAHPRADPMHARQIALPFHPPIRRVAGDIKELCQRNLGVSVKNGPLLDFCQRLVPHGLRRYPFDFDRDARAGFQHQTQGHVRYAPHNEV
jgi:hypothetical protein